MPTTTDLTWVSDWRPNTMRDTNLTNYTLPLTWPSSGVTEYPDRYACYGGYDIHVVRGSQTAPLINHLYVIYDNFFLARASDYIATGVLNFAPTGFISIDFAPRVNNRHFNAIGNYPNHYSFNSNSNTNLAANDTIYVDRDTGVIIAWPVNSPLYGSERWNFSFILDVRMTFNHGTFTTSIRVHIHDSIIKAWLTPSTLTLRPDADHWRLSVMAQFSDGNVGDISHHPGMEWLLLSATDVDFSQSVAPTTPYTEGHLKVTSTYNTAQTNAAKVGAIYKPFAITGQAAPPWVWMTGTGLGALNAPLPTNVNNTAQINIGLSFADGPLGALLTADCVPQSRGLTTFNEVPNILFLPDGYSSGDQPIFDDVIDGLVDSLNKPSKEPFKTFLGQKSINIWSAFFPSEERVCSILSGVVEIRVLPTLINKATYAEPNPAYATLTIEEFIGMVDGLLSSASNSARLSQYWGVEVINPNIGNVPGRYRSTPYRAKMPSEWTLQQLVDRVGYPTIHDVSATAANVLAKWNNLFFSAPMTLPIPTPPPATPAITLDELDTSPGNKNVSSLVFSLWKMLAHRRLIDEHDTAFGISFDTKPKENDHGSYSAPAGIMTGGSTSRTMTYNPQRASRHNINPLLNRYTNSDLTPIGNIWSCSVTPPSVPPNPPVIPGYDRGKDYDYVVFISTGFRYGGMVTPDGLGFCRRSCVAVSTTEEIMEIHTVRVNPSDPNDLRVRLDSLTYIPEFEPNINCQQTTAHEVAHTFLLGDEYGGSHDTGSDTFDCSLNLQNETQVVTAGAYSREDIRWRWPRIEKAGVLNSATATAAGTDHILNLKAGHAKKFVIGEKVYLKRRILPQPAPVSPQILPTLIPNNNQVPPSFYSPELTVTNVDTTNGINIQVSGLTSMTHVAVGSVILKPYEAVISGVGTVTVNTSGVVTTVTGTGTCFLVQARVGGMFICGTQPMANILSVTGDNTLTIAGPFTNIGTASKFYLTPPTTEKYEELISYTIRNTLEHNDRPMTIFPCSINDPTGGDQVPIPTQVNVNAAKTVSYYDIPRKTNINSGQIVGLFQGGAEVNCGVFHPTGSCLMRDSLNEHHVFCPICRYVMTDLIDPSCHGIIDRLYTNIYPEI